MTVGLFDADFNKYNPTMFNLELMKYASYLKNKGELVTLTPFFAPDHYNKFYYRQDLDDGILPNNFYNYNNIIKGGYAFSKTYQPLPLAIEATVPDLSIYESYYREAQKKDQDQIRFLRASIHLRLSLDEKTIWKYYDKAFHITSKRGNLFIHDKNIGNIKNDLETIQTLQSQLADNMLGYGYVGFKYPVILTDETNLLDWLKLRAASKYFTLVFKGVLSNEIVKIIGENGPRYPNLKYFIYMPVIDSSLTDDLILSQISFFYKQIIFLRSHKLFFSLKIIQENILRPEFQLLEDIINEYIKNAQYPSKKNFKEYLYLDNIVWSLKTGREEYYEKLIQFNRVFPTLMQHDLIFSKVSYKEGEFLYER